MVVKIIWTATNTFVEGQFVIGEALFSFILGCACPRRISADLFARVMTVSSAYIIVCNFVCLTRLFEPIPVYRNTSVVSPILFSNLDSDSSRDFTTIPL